MIKIKEAVIVEGKYDKIKLSAIIDTVIIETDGFAVFKDKEKQKFIRFLAEKRGIIIMTDSDSAGFKIRNFINGITKSENIKNVYIPDIYGKEKRKTEMSKEETCPECNEKWYKNGDYHTVYTAEILNYKEN